MNNLIKDLEQEYKDVQNPTNYLMAKEVLVDPPSKNMNLHIALMVKCLRTHKTMSLVSLMKFFELSETSIRRIVKEIRIWPELFLNNGEYLISGKSGYFISKDKYKLEMFYRKSQHIYADRQAQLLALKPLLLKGDK